LNLPLSERTGVTTKGCAAVEKWRGVVAGAVLREGWGEGGAAFLAVRTPSSGDMSDAFVILQSSARLRVTGHLFQPSPAAIQGREKRTGYGDSAFIPSAMVDFMLRNNPGVEDSRVFFGNSRVCSSSGFLTFHGHVFDDAHVLGSGSTGRTITRRLQRRRSWDF
jgi:hypothetical protein